MYVNIPDFGARNWKSPVANYASLPATGNTSGDARITLDTFEIYIWNGSAWIPVSGGSSSPAFGIFQTPHGTYPTATIPTDTLTFTSSDNSVTITGNSTSDTINFQVASSGGTVTSVTASSPLASSGGTTPNISITGSSLTENISSVLTITGGSFSQLDATTIQVQQGSGSQSGYISNTDWNLFNNKQPAGSYITALTGDITATGPGSVSATLATVNSNVGSYTNASITVNAKGLITAASSGTTVSAGGTSGSVQYNNGSNGFAGGNFWTDGNNVAINNTYGYRFNGSGDANWQIGRDLSILVSPWLSPQISTNTLQFVCGNGSGEGLVFGNNSGIHYFELDSNANAWFANNIDYLGSLTGGSSGQFTIDSSGNITKINNITTSWPSTQGASSTILTNNGSGTLSWSTAPVTGITALTGDVTAGPGTGSQVATLATVNSNVGSFGSSTSIPTFTVNAKGLITAASGNVVIAPAGTLTGTTLASNVIYSSLTSLGTQSQALNMGGYQINNMANPTASQDAATKSYVDAIGAGLIWISPVNDMCLADDSLSTPPVSPRASVVYIINTSPTGAWASFGAGHAVWWNSETSVWVDLFPTRTIQAGDRFICNHNAILPTSLIGGSFTGYTNYICTVSGGSPGAWTYSFVAPVASDAVSVTNQNSDHYGQSYTYSPTASPSQWILFSGPASTAVGTALAYSSSVLNVLVDGTTISTNGSNQLEVIAPYITALTGDATASGPGSVPITLASVNSDVGTYNYATITVNAKGLITSASSGSAPTGTVTNVSVVSANGFAGTVATSTTTPAITISTTVNGILYGDGTSVAAAIASNFPILNQNTTGTASNITATSNSTLTTLSSLSLPYSQITGAPAAITALTGDGTASGPGSSVLTLATVNSDVGSYTNANVTVNAKGLITSISSGSPSSYTFADSIVNTSGTVTLVNDNNSPGDSYYYGTDASGTKGFFVLPVSGSGIDQLTGDVTAGPGTGSQAATLATVNSSPGTYVNATITVNGKGLVTSASSNVTVVSKNNGYTVVSSDNGTYFLVDTTSGSFAFDLPTPTSGFIIRIVDSTGQFSNNPFTLEPTGGGVMISGVAGGKMFETAWGGWTIFSDGSNWFVF
jgi:putative lipoic acid-binding regulatory protein